MASTMRMDLVEYRIEFAKLDNDRNHETQDSPRITGRPRRLRTQPIVISRLVEFVEIVGGMM